MKTYPVVVLCRIMSVCPSGFYAWLKSPEPKTNPEDKKIEHKVREIFHESHSAFGSRRISQHMKKQGFPLGRHKASSLMKKLDLTVRRKKQYIVTTDSKHNHKVADNLLNREFNPDKPNQVWTTDITYLKSQSGWVYLAVVIDLFSRQVVGWHVDDSMTSGLCKEALINAYWRRKPKKGLLHHSDRGSQYASNDYQKLLRGLVWFAV